MIYMRKVRIMYDKIAEQIIKQAHATTQKYIENNYCSIWLQLSEAALYDAIVEVLEQHQLKDIK